MPSKPGLSISVSLKLQSRCLPSLGMNWSEPSSVSWSSVKMSTMLGLELGFELGLLRRTILFISIKEIEKMFYSSKQIFEKYKILLDASFFRF